VGWESKAPVGRCRAAGAGEGVLIAPVRRGLGPVSAEGGYEREGFVVSVGTLRARGAWQSASSEVEGGLGAVQRRLCEWRLATEFGPSVPSNTLLLGEPPRRPGRAPLCFVMAFLGWSRRPRTGVGIASGPGPSFCFVGGGGWTLALRAGVGAASASADALRPVPVLAVAREPVRRVATIRKAARGCALDLPQGAQRAGERQGTPAPGRAMLDGRDPYFLRSKKNPRKRLAQPSEIRSLVLSHE
jgi:hypothetical protein